MLGEHCTNGIQAYVCSDTRLILLDTQPLYSASLQDKNNLYEKKNQTSFEFASSENTAEVHGLQMMGFLTATCHVLLLVQDWFVDVQLVKATLAAEMLRPTSPAYADLDGDGDEMVEYFPHLVLVHNKAELDDFTADRLSEMRSFYELALKKSQFRVDSDANVSNRVPSAAAAVGSLNLYLLPDQELEEGKGSSFRAEICFQHMMEGLRRAVFALPRRRISTSKSMSEKSWLAFATKAWDSIKKSSLYQEYGRLM